MSPAYCAVLRISTAAMLVVLLGIEALLAHAQEAPLLTVSVRQDPALGLVLTDAQGWTLYIFTRDQPGVSVCTGQCAVNWPPLTIEGDPVAPPDLPGALGVIMRPDGARQVTYNDMPLYYFAGDTQPGDMNGHGVGGVWLIAKPVEAQPADVQSGEAQPAEAMPPGPVTGQPQPQPPAAPAPVGPPTPVPVATPPATPTPAPAPAATPVPTRPGYGYGYGY